MKASHLQMLGILRLEWQMFVRIALHMLENWGGSYTFPIEFSIYVAELIESKGEEFSLRQIGMHTVDSCRIEKAYRHFGHDITDEDHVINAGLGLQYSKSAL